MYALNKVIRWLQGGNNGQYSSCLHGLNDRKECSAAKSASKSQPEDADDDDDDDEKEPKEPVEVKCKSCKQSCKHASSLMEAYLTQCKKILQEDKKSTQQFLQGSIVSTKLEDYCRKDVLSWLPERLLPKGTTLNCWNPDCKGSVKVNSLQHRGVEDLESNIFIIYSKYECRVCKKFKSAFELDALSAMGVSDYVLARCPMNKHVYIYM
jgi:hypothetical protein